MSASAAEVPTRPDVLLPGPPGSVLPPAAPAAEAPTEDAPVAEAPAADAPTEVVPPQVAPLRAASLDAAPSGAASSDAVPSGAAPPRAASPGSAPPGSALPEPGTRASDAERDAAVGELREHFAAGRISHDTFLHRIDTALGARDQSELPPLFADLPARDRSRGWRAAGWLSPGWAGSVVNRVLSALSVRARPGEPRAGELHPGEFRSGEPRPARGLTRGLPQAPGAPGLLRRLRDVPDPRNDPRDARLLPFPRGAAATFSIGRDARCDLAIDDLAVSRVHARLERTRDGWVLTDLGSTNGTRVNGWLVRDRVTVQAGDLVRFGETEYTFSEGAGAHAPGALGAAPGAAPNADTSGAGDPG